MVLSKVRQVLTSLSQLETSENTTFFIQNTVRAAAGVETISIASGVTLVFDGGMIAGALTGNTETPEATLKLVGNFTSVEAPITQIFGDTVYAKGYWHIDCAYPQWFDAVVGTQSCDTANPHDCSVAINKAAEMKMSGEVFLPAGVYLVSHTIFLRHGINLTGDSATRTKIDKDNILDPEMVDGWGRATYITPFLVGGNSGFSSYKFEWNSDNASDEDAAVSISTPVVVAVNIKCNDSDNVSAPAADMNYPHPNGSIEQIYFYNPNLRLDSAKDCADISQYVCCLVAGGFSFRHVFWENFCRAIKWTQDYNDSKTIYRCNMQSFFGEDVLKIIDIPSVLPYLIDSRGCGDAMIIDGCHLDRGVCAYEDKKTKRKFEFWLYKALALRTCLGGSIRNSIIHGDIDIAHCSALEFADNHCELGMQMNIRWSQISIHDNFIEKGIVPNFVIHAMDDNGEINATFGNVNFSDNKFICNNYADRIPVDKICEHDILLKTRQGIAPYSIDLARNYRVTANSDALSMHPTGIMLATQDTDGNGVAGYIQPFKAFNDHSYFLSDRAAIRRDLDLKQSERFSSLPSVAITAEPNSNIIKASSTPSRIKANALSFGSIYDFYAYAIIDEARGLVSEVFKLNFNGETPYLTKVSAKGQPPLYVECGNLFRLRWNGKQRPYILRIIRRETTVDDIKYAEVRIPVCGARFLHDNSISVEGHLWTELGDEAAIAADISSYDKEAEHPEFVSAAPGLSAIEFRDDNVTIQAPAKPTTGSWEQGDKVFNTTAPTEENPQPGFWIMGGNGWIAR